MIGATGEEGGGELKTVQKRPLPHKLYAVKISQPFRHKQGHYGLCARLRKKENNQYWYSIARAQREREIERERERVASVPQTRQSSW